MKSKLTADDYGKLSDDLKKEYDAGADGNYFLKIEGTGAEDHPLFKARENEKLAKENALRERDTARQELDKLKSAPPPNETEAERQRREALETKHAAELKKVQDDLAARDAGLIESAKSAAITEIAGKLFTTPGRDKLHLEGRVSVEIKDGKPVVTLLDSKGKGTTEETLMKEFRDNTDFRGIVAAPKASGGGAPLPGTSGGGAPDTSKAGQPVNLIGLSGKDLVATMKANGSAPATEG